MVVRLEELGDMLRPIVREEINLALQSLRAEEKENVTEVKFLTRTEVARKLNISLVTLNKHVYDGKIPARRIGRRVLFRAEDIDNSLNRIMLLGGAKQS
jgi:excisionase family DNA binding protein